MAISVVPLARHQTRGATAARPYPAAAGGDGRGDEGPHQGGRQLRPRRRRRRVAGRKAREERLAQVPGRGVLVHGVHDALELAREGLELGDLGRVRAREGRERRGVVSMNSQPSCLILHAHHIFFHKSSNLNFVSRPSLLVSRFSIRVPGLCLWAFPGRCRSHFTPPKPPAVERRRLCPHQTKCSARCSRDLEHFSGRRRDGVASFRGCSGSPKSRTGL